MEKFCQNCGQQNSADALFCRFCASPLTPVQGGGQQPFNPPNQPPNQSSNQPQNQQWKQAFQGNQPVNGNISAGASGRAIGSLILTICGVIFCCLLTSIPGAILGWMEVSAIKQGQSSPKGMLMAQIGFWGGVIMSVISLIAYGLYLLLAVSAGMSNGMNNF